MQFRWALLVLLAGAASESRAAQITDTQTMFSMLCLAEKGTGFDWQNNDWVLSNYKPYSYIVTKVEPKRDDWSCTQQNISEPMSPVKWLHE
jgi:hypothetical protein